MSGVFKINKQIDGISNNISSYSDHSNKTNDHHKQVITYNIERDESSNENQSDKTSNDPSNHGRRIKIVEQPYVRHMVLWRRYTGSDSIPPSMDRNDKHNA
jgi:Ser-tRNA(Ala) deacylase AlaX